MSAHANTYAHNTHKTHPPETKTTDDDEWAALAALEGRRVRAAVTPSGDVVATPLAPAEAEADEGASDSAAATAAVADAPAAALAAAGTGSAAAVSAVDADAAAAVERAAASVGDGGGADFSSSRDSSANGGSAGGSSESSDSASGASAGVVVEEARGGALLFRFSLPGAARSAAAALSGLLRKPARSPAAAAAAAPPPAAKAAAPTSKPQQPPALKQQQQQPPTASRPLPLPLPLPSLPLAAFQRRPHRWALQEAEFSADCVGAKALNLAALRARLPDWIDVPRSVAIPFGSFEAALADPSNAAAAARLEAVLRRLDAAAAAAGSGGGDDVSSSGNGSGSGSALLHSELLAEAREVVATALAPPAGMRAAVRAALLEAGMLPVAGPGAWPEEEPAGGCAEWRAVFRWVFVFVC